MYTEIRFQFVQCLISGFSHCLLSKNLINYCMKMGMTNSHFKLHWNWLSLTTKCILDFLTHCCFTCTCTRHWEQVMYAIQVDPCYLHHKYAYKKYLYHTCRILICIICIKKFNNIETRPLYTTQLYKTIFFAVTHQITIGTYVINHENLYNKCKNGKGF